MFTEAARGGVTGGGGDQTTVTGARRTPGANKTLPSSTALRRPSIVLSCYTPCELGLDSTAARRRAVREAKATTTRLCDDQPSSYSSPLGH